MVFNLRIEVEEQGQPLAFFVEDFLLEYFNIVCVGCCAEMEKREPHILHAQPHQDFVGTSDPTQETTLPPSTWRILETTHEDERCISVSLLSFDIIRHRFGNTTL